MKIVPDRIARAAMGRISKNEEKIMRSLRYANAGTPLAAETDQFRAISRLMAKTGLDASECEALRRGVIAKLDRETVGGPERIWGATVDFLSVSFLLDGVRAAASVARIVSRRNRSAIGTGFLVSDQLLLTNHHVIETANDAEDMIAEFDYELNPHGMPVSVTSFTFDPGRLYLSDDTDDLDFAIVAIGPKLDGEAELADFGFCELSPSKDKHALGEVANIVQHPDGRRKEVVLRENRLVSRLEHVLHYVADTQPGSSGSPVFNNEWRVIALHHWGSPWRQTRDADGNRVPTKVNEGIRTSAIVAELEMRLDGVSGERRELLEDVLDFGEASVARRNFLTKSSDSFPSYRATRDGVATWTIPVEFSVRVPRLLSQTAADVTPAAGNGEDDERRRRRRRRRVEVDRDYGNREGYDPRFLQGHEISLPALSEENQRKAAKLIRDGAEIETKFQHFSVVMNAERRLAFFTACNIDGERAWNINRKTGKATRAEGLRLDEGSEGAEAREKWYDDPRIRKQDQTNDDLYLNQRLPWAPNSTDRMNQMFQRGHLVRRKEPAWGTKSAAIKADADTFHFVNCAPQVGFLTLVPRQGDLAVTADVSGATSKTMFWTMLSPTTLAFWSFVGLSSAMMIPVGGTMSSPISKYRCDFGRSSSGELRTNFVLWP